jgi:hypothetical protein
LNNNLSEIFKKIKNVLNKLKIKNKV